MDAQVAILDTQPSNKITQLVTVSLFALGLGAGAVFGVAVLLLVA